MSQYEQLKLYAKRLQNISNEIKKFLEEENYDEAITKSELKDKVFKEYANVRGYLKLTEEQEKEVRAWEQKIAESDKYNIDFLQNSMMKVSSELKSIKDQDKLSAKYNNNLEDESRILDLKDSEE